MNYFIHVIVILFLALTHTVEGQVWDSLGNSTYGDSKHIHEIDNLLYVGGIDTSQGVSIFNMGSWDGNMWQSVGGGIDATYGNIYGTAKLNGRIFIGGMFNYAGGPYPWPAPHIFHLTAWDGIQYYNLGYPNGNHISSLYTYDNELYIGTNWVTINNQPYYGILKYNDTTYSDVGGGLNGFPRAVHVMEEFNGNLIAGGEFSIAGSSLQVTNIASWDGTNWHTMGSGLDYGVRALVVDTVANILYAGGSFNNAGSIPVNHVAMWDGNSWQNLGQGVPIVVTALCFYKNELYAGGGNAWGLNPSSFYKWNGSVWTPIVPGPLGNIHSLKVYQGTLYVAGGFTEIGGVRYSGIAKYTDTTTVSLPEENTSSNNIFVYPNPISKTVTLQLTVNNLNKIPLTIVFYNSLGQQIIAHEIINSPFSISVESFSSGIYSYQVKDRQSTISTGKLVVE